MQCPQEHLKTIVYAKFEGQTKCIMGNSKIENRLSNPISNLFRGTVSMWQGILQLSHFDK